MDHFPHEKVETDEDSSDIDHLSQNNELIDQNEEDLSNDQIPIKFEQLSKEKTELFTQNSNEDAHKQDILTNLITKISVYPLEKKKYEIPQSDFKTINSDYLDLSLLDQLKLKAHFPYLNLSAPRIKDDQNYFYSKKKFEINKNGDFCFFYKCMSYGKGC